MRRTTCVLQQAGQKYKSSAEKRYCTASMHAVQLLNISCKHQILINNSTAVPRMRNMKYPACFNTRSLAEIYENTHHFYQIVGEITSDNISYCTCLLQNKVDV